MKYLILLMVLLMGCTNQNVTETAGSTKTIDILDISGRDTELNFLPKKLYYVGQTRGYDLYILYCGNATVSYQFPTVGLPAVDVRPVNRDDINAYIYNKVDEKNIDVVKGKLKILNDISMQAYIEKDRLEKILTGQ